MKQAVQVTILGQQYTVKSDASPEEVRQVAAFVNEKIGEVKAATKAVDTLNTAILALLNVSAGYLRLQEQASAKNLVGNRLQQLVKRLEQSLPVASGDAAQEELITQGEGGPLGGMTEVGGGSPKRSLDGDFR